MGRWASLMDGRPELLWKRLIGMKAQGQCQQALELLDAWPTADHDPAVVAFVRGTLLQELHQDQAALKAYTEADTFRPHWPELLVNRAVACMSLQRWRQALNDLRQALELKPDLPQAWLNLGNLHWHSGQINSAQLAFDRAVAHQPHYPSAHYNLGMLQMLRGDFQRGWQGYSWRFEAMPNLLPSIQLPRCISTPKKTQPLLLVQEQGLGDVFQFVRYANLIKGQCAELLLAVDAKLVPILEQSCLADQVLAFPIADTQLPKQCCWMPLLSLAASFQVSRAAPRWQAPYLRLDLERCRAWRTILQPGPLRIAVHWQGNPDHERGISHGRSLELEQLSPITQIPTIELVSLQKGPGSEQLHPCSFRHKFTAAQPQIDQTWCFLDTAAIASCCDLVITNDTALAHLCGALGLPVWILLQAIPEWRWGLEGNTTPWYPSARLFRQRAAGDWRGVMDAVVEALQELMRERA